MSTTETYLLIIDEGIIPFSNLLLLCRAIKCEKKYATIRRKLLKGKTYNINGYLIRKTEPMQTTKHVKK